MSLHGRTPVVTEHREYYREPEPSRQLTYTPSMMELGSRDPYRRDRSGFGRYERYDIDSSYHPEEHHYEIGTNGMLRGRIPRRLVRDRSRSHVSSGDGK